VASALHLCSRAVVWRETSLGEVLHVPLWPGEELLKQHTTIVSVALGAGEAARPCSTTRALVLPLGFLADGALFLWTFNGIKSYPTPPSGLGNTTSAGVMLSIRRTYLGRCWPEILCPRTQPLSYLTLPPSAFNVQPCCTGRGLMGYRLSAWPKSFDCLLDRFEMRLTSISFKQLLRQC